MGSLPKFFALRLAEGDGKILSSRASEVIHHCFPGVPDFDWSKAEIKMDTGVRIFPWENSMGQNVTSATQPSTATLQLYPTPYPPTIQVAYTLSPEESNATPS